MSVDPESINTIQLPLFDFQKASSYAFELFPKVWGAAEALTDVNLESRQAGMNSLEELNAARFSPLISYLLFTRLNEPDLALRAQVVRVLADVLGHDEEGKYAPETVRQVVLHYLSTMRLDQIYALLEVAEYEESAISRVITILKADSQAGNDLLEILLDRKMPIALRKQAANLIAWVGYVDAIQGLERFIYRIESKLNGQQFFALTGLDAIDESQLLPIVKNTLSQLQAP